MNFDQYDYRIADYFLSALINGDCTGLTDEESEELDTWESALPEGKGRIYDYEEDSDNWGKCEISGLFAQIVTVKVLIVK